MISKKIVDIQESLDIDLQLIASDLDTSVKDIRYISKNIIQDAILFDAFTALIDNIKKDEGFEITSFDDNTILYEYLDDFVVINTNLGNDTILFDSSVRQKIENRINHYRNFE